MRESADNRLLLHLVTDRSLSLGRSLVEVVAEAVAGGVTCVQLREKTCSTREFLGEALALKALLQPLGLPLIINDRVDIALAVGADGVHLGQSDMPISHARRLLGPDYLIGISAESVEDAIAAEQQGADYIGISPVFSTPTKTDTASALGLEGVRQIRELVRVPLVGIGGINQANAHQVLAAGADGVAVVSAIMAAESPQLAAEAIRVSWGNRPGGRRRF
ncbi:MAG: thiamine phosphate synthase [Trichlorobacter sp.]|uniref:thiamine phosphate synthase n=1 Tax=Trichlorobacter sp. TaxID=2911007 RepID=UPI0025627334|nr:thiamine phosphate synthase [Trichlorobacter sp.]MDK9717282.1 thiamine phosphate synthase [Trichlorobacter sp.]